MSVSPPDVKLISTSPERGDAGQRVLQVVHDFVPETIAGAEVNTYKLATDLHSRHGYEVHVFCRGCDFECEQYRVRDEMLDGLHVRRVDFGRDGPRNRWRRHDPRVTSAFRRTLAEVRPAVVHFQHFMYLSTDLAAIAKEYGAAVVISLRNFWFRCPVGSLAYHDGSLCDRTVGLDCLPCLWPARDGRKRKVLPWKQLDPLISAGYRATGGRLTLVGTLAEMLPSLTTWESEFRAALLAADAIHSPSEFLKSKLVEFGVPTERVSVVPNGFVFDPSRTIAKRPAEKLRLTMIGTHPLKGLHVLVDAFSRLPQDRVALSVYGQVADAKYFEDQRRRATGLSVEFRGVYSQDQLYDVFADTDVLVVPSVWYENCPTVIREAFATGTPVVAADVGGMAEAIRDGTDGLLFHVGDADSLHRALNWLVDRPDEVTRLAAGITLPLTQQQCTDGIRAIYEIARRRGRADVREAAL